MTRSALLLPALLAGAALAPQGAAAAPPPGAGATAAPGTLARSATLDRSPVRPGLRIDFVGVQWRGPREGARIRLRRDGGWGAWRALHAGELHRPGRRASELVAAGGASAYQVRLPRGAHAGRATAIDATRPGATPSRLASARPRHPFPVRQCFRTRAQWGADEALRFAPDGTELWPPAYFPVQKLTVHHTATDAGGTDPAAVVRAIYRFHAVDLAFGDIGYHLLVDEQGCVYEGRHSGPDRRPVFAPRTTGPGAPAAVNGGHVAGFNAGNVGVALLGDFTTHAPTARAQAASVRTLATLVRATGLDPLGRGTYVNPITGATRDVDTISGHLDWLATECPGALLYPLLPELRHRVAQLAGRGALTMRLLVASTRGQGHFRPLMPWAHAARAAGHDVLVAGPPALEPAVLAEGLGFQPVGAADPRRLAHIDRMLEGRPFFERIAIATTELFVGAHGRAALRGMREVAEAWRPDLILRETAEVASQITAEALGIPVVRGGIALATPSEDWWLTVASSALDDLRATVGVAKDPGGDRIRSTPVFTQAPAVLDEHQGEVPADVRRFRAGADQPAAPLPDWWPDAAADAPLVLVTFGTVVPMDGHFPGLYRTVVDALAGRGLRVLVTTGREADPAELGPLPAGVRVERWVPQAAVMPHAAAMVHHGGAGTTLTGLAAGLPMVVLPLSADQPLNARRVAELGAGIALEGGAADAGLAGEALEAVLAAPTHREAAGRVAAEIAALPPVAEAVGAFEAVAAGAFRPA